MTNQFDYFIKDKIVRESVYNLLDRLMVYQNDLKNVDLLLSLLVREEAGNIYYLHRLLSCQPSR
mgnify:CR=1 FL=1